MGSIYKRGTRANARYYLHYRAGTKEDGTPRYEMRAAKGARTMEDARKQLAVIEVRVGQGLPPVPEEQPLKALPSNLRPLLERWRDGLSNRNAEVRRVGMYSTLGVPRVISVARWQPHPAGVDVNAWFVKAAASTFPRR